MVLWKSVVMVLWLWVWVNVATVLGQSKSKLPTLNSKGINYRLRNETFPIHYNLELTTRIDKEDFAFQGKVQIKIGVIKPTYVISIHKGRLNITQMQLHHNGNYSRLLKTSYSYDETTEILLISSKQKLERDEYYTLTISYDGILGEDLYGFYRSYYNGDNNTKIYLATTHFEPTFARRAFPCYDEPKFKATFDISITHGKSYHALSNMAVKEEFDCDNETKTTVFETSVKMSTYLVAFVVSNFDHISKESQRVFTEPKLIKGGDFALNVGIKILDSLATYLNVSYSISKMDQISIPQFHTGAMENWGLVTYPRYFLSIDPDKFPVKYIYNMVNRIAHEFSHQWFGNLVTPEWWTYVWLKEGFATCMATDALQVSFPEMRSEEYDWFDVQPVFVYDSKAGTRPMTTYEEDPNSVRKLLDAIAYEKSRFVLRMVKHFLTEPVWKDGLTQYLNNRAFNSARDTDLFDALQTAVDRSNVTLSTSVTEILNTWTLNKGYPIISVKRIGEGLHFSQKRCIEDGSKDPNNTLWWVPINIATKSNPDFANTAADTWFNSSEQFYTPHIKIKPDDWFLVNKKGMYYYRVNYESENWKKLADELSYGNYTKIDTQNRVQLLNEVFFNVQHERINFGEALNILKYLKRETEYVPWATIEKPMSELYRKVEAVIQTDHLINFMREMSDKFYKTYGPISKKGDDFHEKMARPLAIKWACESGNEQCLADTHELLLQYVYDDLELEPDTRGSVICGGLRSANQTTVDAFVQKMKSMHFSLYIVYCSCIQNEEVLMYAIDRILSEPNLRSGNKNIFLAIVYIRSHLGLTILWKYIADNWETFFNDFGTNIAMKMAYYIYRPEEESVAMDIFNKMNSTFSEEFKLKFKAQVKENVVFASTRYNEINEFLTDYFSK